MNVSLCINRSEVNGKVHIEETGRYYTLSDLEEALRALHAARRWLRSEARKNEV